MQSNFLALKDLNLELFNSIHEAENLFIDGYNKKVANELRCFCEGFLILCLEIPNKFLLK